MSPKHQNLFISKGDPHLRWLPIHMHRYCCWARDKRRSVDFGQVRHSVLGNALNFHLYILSPTGNATLNLILNNSFTIWEIHSKFGRDVAMPSAKITSEGHESWSVCMKMPHVWQGHGFNKLPKSSFQRYFVQQFNKSLSLFYFSSILPSCICKEKHTGDSCNGVHHLVKWCRSLRNVQWTGPGS